MKKTILWSAIITLMSAQAQAEITQQVPPPPQKTSAATMSASSPQTPTTSNPVPSISAPAKPAQPLINCDYKIPAEIKKVDQTLVLTWAKNATTQSFDFDPENIDAQLQKLQTCFTEQGWTGFNTALKKSGNIEAIKAQKLNVSSQVEEPVLVMEAKDNQWKINLPLQVVYQNDKEKVTQLLSVDVTVSRKTNGDLGITQMIAAPRGTVTTKTGNPAANGSANPIPSGDNMPVKNQPETPTTGTPAPVNPTETFKPSTSQTPANPASTQ